MLLKAIFDLYEIKTIAVSSATEALEILNHIIPNLLISEISLPEEDGYSLMKKVQAFEIAHHVEIPAIALTTSNTPIDRAHALNVGFKEYLTKPIDIDSFMQAAISMIQKAQLVTA